MGHTAYGSYCGFTLNSNGGIVTCCLHVFWPKRNFSLKAHAICIYIYRFEQLFQVSSYGLTQINIQFE